jgi:1-deoxy-D-xylulose-5-phosphate reductoisomerase
MTELVKLTRPDVLLSGVMGSAGLEPTLAAIACGADLAIANKETLVMAGCLVMPAARAAGVSVLPVDSEHSAIFQCLSAGRREEVRKVVITASGGALRDWDEHLVDDATVEQALAHPTWNMGRKITIDSATMMNKALEMVEAHWLFGLEASQIQVILHPQSIVHSLVEFQDGSVIAQLGRPDMALPISYALHYPHRPVRPGPSLDLAAVGQLTFEPLGPRFARAVELGYDVIGRGGVAGAVLNAANEAAVEAFLAGRIRFAQIVALVEDALGRSLHALPAGAATLAELAAADRWARAHVAAAVEQTTQQTRMP